MHTSPNVIRSKTYEAALTTTLESVPSYALPTTCRAVIGMFPILFTRMAQISSFGFHSGVRVGRKITRMRQHSHNNSSTLLWIVALSATMTSYGSKNPSQSALSQVTQNSSALFVPPYILCQTDAALRVLIEQNAVMDYAIQKSESMRMDGTFPVMTHLQTFAP